MQTQTINSGCTHTPTSFFHKHKLCYTHENFIFLYDNSIVIKMPHQILHSNLVNNILYFSDSFSFFYVLGLENTNKLFDLENIFLQAENLNNKKVFLHKVDNQLKATKVNVPIAVVGRSALTPTTILITQYEAAETITAFSVGTTIILFTDVKVTSALEFNNILIVGFIDGTALILGKQFKMHDEAIRTIDYLPEFDWIVTNGQDNIIKIWKIEIQDNLKMESENKTNNYCDEKELKTTNKIVKLIKVDFLDHHTDWITKVCLNKDVMFSSSYDNTIIKWRYDERWRIDNILGGVVQKDRAYYSVIVDGNRIVGQTHSGGFQLFEEFTPKRYFSGFKGSIRSIDVENDLVLVSSADKTVRIFSVENEYNEKMVDGLGQKFVSNSILREIFRVMDHGHCINEAKWFNGDVIVAADETILRILGRTVVFEEMLKEMGCLKINENLNENNHKQQNNQITNYKDSNTTEKINLRKNIHKRIDVNIINRQLDGEMTEDQNKVENNINIRQENEFNNLGTMLMEEECNEENEIIEKIQLININDCNNFLITKQNIPISATNSELYLTPELINDNDFIGDEYSLCKHHLYEKYKIYGHFFEVQTVCVSNKYIFSANKSASEVHSGIFVFRGEEKVEYLKVHSLGINKLRISNNKKLLIGCSRDKKVSLYKINEEDNCEKLDNHQVLNLIVVYSTHLKSVVDCNFNYDYTLFCSVGRDGYLVIYSINCLNSQIESKVVKKIRCDGEPKAVVFINNNLVAVGMENGEVAVVNIVNESFISFWACESVTAMCFSNGILWVGCKTGLLRSFKV